MANYGEVGVNVGSVGRWTRFILGILIVVFVATDFYPVTHAHNAVFYMMMALSLLGIISIFTLVHVLIGDKLIGKSAWWGTLIFVVPAMFLLIAPEFDSSLQVGHWLNVPALNHPFRLALLAFIGISFLFQWRARYGGCEVVAITNFLIRKNFGSYCVPLLPLDAIEKAIIERKTKTTSDTA